MRVLTLLPLLYTPLYFPTALAAPGCDHVAQVVFGNPAVRADAVHEGLAYGNKNQDVVQPVAHNSGNPLQEDKVESWSEEGREFMKQNGLVCTSFGALSRYQLNPVRSTVKSSWSNTRPSPTTNSGRGSPIFVTHLSNNTLDISTLQTENTFSSGSSQFRSIKPKPMFLDPGFSSRGAIQARIPSSSGSTVALGVAPVPVFCLNLVHA